MNNKLNNEEFDSAVESLEGYEFTPNLKGYIVDEAVHEAMITVITLPLKVRFTIEDVLSKRTVQYLEEKDLLMAFECHLIDVRFENNGCETAIWVGPEGFLLSHVKFS